MFIVDILKRKKKLRLKKLIEYRKKHKATSNQNESKVEESNVNYDPPEGAHNRVGRWTNTELTKLKLAMQIFGDQSWKKIRKFLIIEEKESKKSKAITKVKTTFRSVKAI